MSGHEPYTPAEASILMRYLVDLDRLNATAQHLAAAEAEVAALRKGIEAHRLTCRRDAPEPCGLDNCPCCREANSQAEAITDVRREAGRLRDAWARLNPMLLEALAVTSLWWNSTPGDSDDISRAGPRAEALLADVKVCSCGAVYIGAEEWRALKYCGTQRMDGAGPDFELRDCARCKSTLARAVA